MEKKTGKHPIEELDDMLRTLQEKEIIQNCMVQKFQKLFREKGPPSSVIRNFPYPIAVFDQDGDLVFVNSALSDETGLYTTDLSRSKHSIFNRITDENLRILDAVENVFMDKTTFLADLSDPLDIFMNDNSGEKISSSEYREAFFLPVVKDKGQTTLGAVIFMKHGSIKTE